MDDRVTSSGVGSCNLVWFYFRLDVDNAALRLETGKSDRPGLKSSRDRRDINDAIFLEDLRVLMSERTISRTVESLECWRGAERKSVREGPCQVP